MVFINKNRADIEGMNYYPDAVKTLLNNRLKAFSYINILEIVNHLIK